MYFTGIFNAIQLKNTVYYKGKLHVVIQFSSKVVVCIVAILTDEDTVIEQYYEGDACL